jgi:DNA-directed RNA polymerase specialized sigma24 family protein
MLVPFSRYDEDSTAEHADLAKDEASRELRVAIAECAKELKPEQRLVIMLASEDYKPKDISRATKWKKRVVEGLLYRGRNAMRACLERKGVMES